MLTFGGNSTSTISGHNGRCPIECDVESLNSSNHSHSQQGGSTPPPSSSRQKRRLSSSSSLDSSSGSDNSYVSTDDTSTSIKVRLTIYGSSLFEMAIGDSEDGRGKKGLSDEDGTHVQSGQKVVGTVNRKTAWLIFFSMITVGAFFCLYEREKTVVDDTIRLLEYGEIAERHD